MGQPEHSIGSQCDRPCSDRDADGMFTAAKVRAGMSSDADPGWYKHPRETVAAAVGS